MILDACMTLFDLYDLPTLFCVFFILAGLRAALDAKTVFRPSLPCKKNCSTLFWRRQDRFWESVLREASDLVRASGCGESRNGGRWVSQTIHIHPGHVGKRGTPAWGHTYVRLPCQGSGQELPNLGYILPNLGHTLPNLSQTWATYCQSWATYCQNWDTDCLVDCPTQLTLAI